MDWEDLYRKGEVFWDKGEASRPLRDYLEQQASTMQNSGTAIQLSGKTLVPGCGRGHEVALAVEYGLDAIGLDIAPTALAEARARYPHLAERFVLASLFDPPAAMRGAFDLVLEHTCMSALPPNLRGEYRRGIDLTLRPGGLLIGVWYINPSLEPGYEGPPFPFSVEDLTALFTDGYKVVEDYIPQVAFPGREGRERLRVLKKLI